MKIVLVGLLSGTIAFGLGAFWYTALFGKAWSKYIGITDEQIKEAQEQGMRNSFFVTMGRSFVIELVVGVLVGFLLSMISTNASLLGAGILLAIITVLSSAKNYLFEESPFGLFLINESYKLITILITVLMFSTLGF